MEFDATFYATAVSFIVFTLIMNKILYKPISDIIQKRENYFAENAQVVKENSEKINTIQEDENSKLAQAHSEAKTDILTGIDKNKKEKSEAQNSKKIEIAGKYQELKNSLNTEKQEKSNELNSKVNELSDCIVDKMLGENS